MTHPIELNEADELNEAHRQRLLRLAYTALHHGLQTGMALQPDTERFEPSLRREAASFVTLKRGGELRGCIGSLQAHRPLAIDVAANAFAAGFRDYRFGPLGADELTTLNIGVSVLTPAQPMAVDSEQALIDALQVGIDGLILEDAGGRRATFLPAVWEHFDSPKPFIDALRQKAGLPAGYWSEQTKAWRYRSLSFNADVCALSG